MSRQENIELISFITAALCFTGGIITFIVLASVVINDKNNVSGWESFTCSNFQGSITDSGYCYKGYITADVEYDNSTIEVELFYPGTNYPLLVDCVKSSSDITSWISSLSSDTYCYIEDITDEYPRGVTVVATVNTWIGWLCADVILLAIIICVCAVVLIRW